MEWRILHNEEVNIYYRLVNIVKVIISRRWAAHIAGKQTGTRTFKARVYRRLEENIRIYLEEIDVNTRNWIDLTQKKDYCISVENVTLDPMVP